MVELQPSKLITWVRFPSPAPLAGVAELADARDLKSCECKSSYRFDSGPRHVRQWRNGRRASFRRWWGRPRGGSSPLCRTNSKLNMRSWRNRQTRCFEGAVLVRGYEFKSHRPHQQLKMRLWWNWQTRYFEGVVLARAYEFKSRQPHHIENSSVVERRHFCFAKKYVLVGCETASKL